MLPTTELPRAWDQGVPEDLFFSLFNTACTHLLGRPLAQCATTNSEVPRSGVDWLWLAAAQPGVHVLGVHGFDWRCADAPCGTPYLYGNCEGATWCVAARPVQAGPRA